MEKIDKAQAVEILEEISLLLELKGENIFKVRAFPMRRASSRGTLQI